MFKVMITQIIRNKVIGKCVMVENFKDLQEAENAGLINSLVYEHQVFQIREYEDNINNIISFDENDTGKIVYEYIDELIIGYMHDDICISEWLDSVLSDTDDKLNIVAQNISDEWLTKLLVEFGSDNWYCKDHKLYCYE